MKYRDKVLLLFACFSLLFSIITIKDTYAKYIDSITGVTDINVARWRILVNDSDIRNSATTTIAITPTFEGTDHIAENVIAPTSEGYFDIIIDCTDTDVSFNYSITFEENLESSVSDLVITGYAPIENGTVGTLVNASTSSGTIQNTVLKSDEVNEVSLRIYIKWDDSSDAIMDNAADTQATISGPALINTVFRFTQVTETPEETTT